MEETLERLGHLYALPLCLSIYFCGNLSVKAVGLDTSVNDLEKSSLQCSRKDNHVLGMFLTWPEYSNTPQ